MKRFLSVIMTAVLLVNLICAVPAVADAAETFTVSTVYVDNSVAKWNTVYIYGWGNGINGEAAMTRIAGTDYWYYDLPQPLAAGTECFLFKNTASNWDKQSPNVTITEPYNCYKLHSESKGQGTWTIYSTGYTVYYVDSANFDQPYAYAWNEGGESCGDMPGVAMTKTAAVSPDGSPVYSYTFDTAYESIIFGDGADSWTQDLEFKAGQFLYWSDDTWYELLSDIPVPDSTVYFQNNWLWSDVKLYYWGGSVTSPEWPGDPMELYGNDGTYDVYSYTVPHDADGFLITGIPNDGSGSLTQTPNIESWYDGACYSMLWTGNNDVVENDISVILPEEDTAEVVGYSLSLTGKIGVNFHFDISDGLAYNGDTKVIFTVPSGGKTYTEEVNIGYAELDDNGNYVFTCYVAAKEMTSVIKAQLVSTDFTGEEEEYTVQAYADYILSHPEDFPEEQALVKAMLNYGTAAQLHFDHNTDSLANDTDNMSDADRTVAAQDLSAYAPVVEGEEGKVQFCGGSLVLKSETALKLYFRVNSDIQNPAVGVNGMTASLTPNGRLYELKFSDIPASELGDVFTVRTDGLTIRYSALSYAYLAQSSADATLVAVANALGAYYAAVNAYNGA